MAQPFRIETNLKEFNRRMDNHISDMQRAMSYAAGLVGKFMEEKIPPYPPASRSPYPFKTPRQRMFVILAIKEGLIDVPYRRTGALGRSITSRSEAKGNSYVTLIGTNILYSPWVISRDKEWKGSGPQSTYHKGTWWTLEDTVEKHMAEALKIYRTKILASLF